ncbi:MAG: trypsin-like peptidase domain-containing protein [Clostridia bacterium]|nr:trypsin-like peptidase domain-containing protein [Clostridia bacterium]
MNQNFDNNNNSSKDPFSGYEVYSKQYTPGEDGYTSETGGNGSRNARSRQNGRLVTVVCVTLAVLLLCSAAAFVSASVARSYYGELYETETESDRVVQTEQELTGEADTETDLNEPENLGSEGNFFFSSSDDTDIRLSDTTYAPFDGQVGDDDMTFAEVVALVADSVVEITTSETLRNGIVNQSGAGSGVIVNQSGVIITNNHVIEGASNITVRLTNGNVYDAALVATDAETDIAVVKIEPKETLTVAVRGNSDNIVVGEEVLAIGNPLGMLGGTVTNGIVSAREREVTVEGETMVLLQHNAAISPGNSGGALFNMRGELIGIVNAKYSSSGAEGLGFAIPMNTVMEVYEDLCEYGYVKGRPDHGITLATDRYYFFQGYLYIYSSRYTDELQMGDRVLSIDGVSPTTVDEAYALLDKHGVGEEIVIVVLRDNSQITVTLTVHEYEPMT